MEIGITQTADVTNPDVGDLALDAFGDLIYHSVLATEVAQRLFVRLNFFKGDWFLGLEEGIPYYQSILTKASDKIIRAVFGEAIRGTQGVAEVLQITYNLNRRTRTLELVFRCRLTDGTTFQSSDFGPFIIAT